MNRTGADERRVARRARYRHFHGRKRASRAGQIGDFGTHQGIETRLGTRLVERSTRRLPPTEPAFAWPACAVRKVICARTTTTVRITCLAETVVVN